MRLVCISDTHSLHEKMLPLPNGDVLVHAGDCTNSGSLLQFEGFASWFGSQPHRHKVLVAGNHDRCCEMHPEWTSRACESNGIIYLRGEAAMIGGLKFYGFPWQPVFRWMSFNASEGERWGRLKLVPDDAEVLVTHGPALGILDWIPDIGKHVGCRPLAKTIDRLPRLKAHIFGHIHEGYGFLEREIDGIKFANASICTERYRPTNPPIIIDL